MRLLLDTHVFLWWVSDVPEISRRARSAIASPGNDCLLSVASCWEMAIKVGLGKLKLPAPIERFIPEQLAANAFGLLGIDLRHTARVAHLAFHHRDPFDRLLVAQAIEDGLALVSADRVFRKYGIKRVW
ncbi:MAG TPA: type II toxin-antitoxin system VapC family toxin [Candidatus Kryptonia bacterium]|nr:type II toxin-antitoxin system VapC family toxin [Candidatus Kryptonia bacterium]